MKLWKRSVGRDDKLQLQLEASSEAEMIGVTSVVAFRNGTRAVAAYQDAVIRVLNLESSDDDSTKMHEISKIDPGLLEAWTICLSPAEDVVFSGTHRGSINIWSMESHHEKMSSLDTHNKFILSTACSCDMKLATSGADGYVNVFDINTSQNIRKVEAHALPTRSIAFSPDGNLIYTASDDRHVSVYDTVSGAVVNSFSQTGMAFSVDTSSDHRHFAVACADHTVALWDLGMQRIVNSYDQHSDQVWSVCFDKSDSSGKRFASVGDDSLLQLYE